MSRETCACRLCGTQTPMLGTKLCDSCWHIERAVHGNPEIARKVLAACDDDDGAYEAREAAQVRLRADIAEDDDLVGEERNDEGYDCDD